MSGASIDLRGFVFSFEGLRKKYQWELDALQAKMIAAHAEVRRAADSLEVLRTALNTHGMNISQALTKNMNPLFHQRSISYLADARSAIIAQETQLLSLRQAHEQLRVACLEKQRKMEILNNVQEQQMQDFVRAEQTRLANESDRDWISRNISRTRAVKISAKISTINAVIEKRTL